MSRERVTELVRLLLEASEQGRISWEETGFRDTYAVGGMPHGLSLQVTRARFNPESYRPELREAHGRVIADLEVGSGDRDPDTLALDALRRIHRAAARQVQDVEGNIDRAIEYLQDLRDKTITSG